MNPEHFKTKTESLTAPIIDTVYLGLPGEMYTDDTSIPVEDRQETRLALLLDDPERTRERTQMAHNFGILCKRLEQLTDEQRDQNFPNLLRNLVLEIKQAEIDALEDRAEQTKQRSFVNSLKVGKSGLFSHLAETESTTYSLIQDMIQTSEYNWSTFDRESQVTPNRFEDL